MSREEYRKVPFELTELRESTDGDDGLTMTGYAAVFNAPTEIREFDGSTFLEQIAPGAFKRTVNSKPVLQFDHGTHPVIGSLPLGSIRELREDDHGLYVEARISDNWLTLPVRDAIREGAIDGMSFRFEVRDDEWQELDDGRQLRTLHEVKLHELGPVVFPAYRETEVSLRTEGSTTYSSGNVHAVIEEVVSDDPTDEVTHRRKRNEVEAAIRALDLELLKEEIRYEARGNS